MDFVAASSRVQDTCHTTPRPFFNLPLCLTDLQHTAHEQRASDEQGAPQQRHKAVGWGLSQRLQDELRRPGLHLHPTALISQTGRVSPASHAVQQSGGEIKANDWAADRDQQ